MADVTLGSFRVTPGAKGHKSPRQCRQDGSARQAKDPVRGMRMKVDHRIQKGWARDILPSAWKCVCGLMSTYGRIYFGATSSPDSRANRHAKSGKPWTKMVLLFETSSLAAAQRVERDLITLARESRFRLEPDNVAEGGEGLLPGQERYWVYALVGR